jgi:hypothetical protein
MPHSNLTWYRYRQARLALIERGCVLFDFRSSDSSAAGSASHLFYPFVTRLANDACGDGHVRYGSRPVFYLQVFSQLSPWL